MGSIWHILAGIGGASAVAMGAYGAHGFKPVDKYYDLVFERANKYHFMGSFVLALAPMMKRSSLVGGLAAAGIVGFSGSCYAVALTEDRSVGKLAPFG
ncbi:putative Transmembrane protein 256-like [Nannochloris sp. 'desiccata']|nr:putative Transmembrane protein 256-like [Chlorella desiccata (nom. nud.)]